MKTRNGFVSNSSSSSFIVAFPRKPKSEKDVLDFMFGGKEGGIEGLSYRQVAERVYNDMKNLKRMTLDALVEELQGRYYYYSSGNVFTPNYERDADGGNWPQKRERYFCSDAKLAEEFKKALIEQDMENNKLSDREKEITSSRFKMETVPYAYEGGSNFGLNRTYTDEEVRAYKNYMISLTHFRETDPEFLKCAEDKKKHWQESGKRIRNIRTKLAHKDAKNFMNDNKGKYIFVVNYGDENGDGNLEHGNIFRNVPHLVISNH
jgi:hypothetical protein